MQGNIRILEIGVGGNEKYPLRFRSRYYPNAEYYFIDKDKPNIELKNFIQIDVDGNSLPFKANYFDEIYASHILEHLNNPLHFLEEIYRVLKHGGKLHIWTPNKKSKNAALDPDHKKIYDYKTLRIYLVSCNFKMQYPSEMLNWANTLPRIVLGFLRRLHYRYCDEIYLVGVKP